MRPYRHYQQQSDGDVLRQSPHLQIRQMREDDRRRQDQQRVGVREILRLQAANENIASSPQPVTISRATWIGRRRSPRRHSMIAPTIANHSSSSVGRAALNTKPCRARDCRSPFGEREGKGSREHLRLDGTVTDGATC
jgi:hypothetical protein